MKKLRKIGFGGLLIVTLLSLNAGCVNKDGGTANEKAVKAYYAAYEKKDWTALNSLLDTGFKFSSPQDDHINIAAYKQKCWPNAYNIKMFDIDKMLVKGDDAFVTYNGWTTDGRVFRNTEYFKFKDGKIMENSCFFGPGVSYPNNKAK